MTELPEFYFRTRENGAFVFRIDTENRMRRIEMDQIAVVNIRNGEIKPHGSRELSPEEIEVITDWIVKRRRVLAERDIDDILRSVDHLNLTTQWAQSRATDEQLEAVSDSLLLAMHDLRSVLTRKKAERLMAAQGRTDTNDD
jgi:peroxiredoxin